MRGSAADGARRPGGFTLLELLTVLGILSLLLGLSIGVLARNVPRRELARNELLDKLRRARVFAVAEQSPSSVVLRPGNEEEWPTVTALGRRVVGSWHLEGNDLEGLPHSATGEGYEAHPDGKLGKCVRLVGSSAAWLDFGRSSSFESPHGLACELFLHLDRTSARPLVTKGDVFSLVMDQEGHLSVSVRTRPLSGVGFDYISVASDVPVIVPGRWVKVAASFDGLVLQIRADDGLVAELVLPGLRDVALDPRAPVRLGSPETGFDARVDEFRWGVYVAETSEPLMDTEVETQSPWVLVRFAPGGGLDPRFHPGPTTLSMRTIEGHPIDVEVGLLGDVQ